MTSFTASQPLDANGRTLNDYGFLAVDSQVLIGNNTTVVVPIFKITGTVNVLGLWGVVTTVLGANNTAAYFRLNDQTAQPSITLSTGVTLSALSVGSVIVKKGLAAAAAVAIDAAAGRVNEPTTLETDYLGGFILTQKTGGIETDIEFVYTTTDAPTSGAIQFFCRYLPISIDGLVTSL